MNRLIKFEIMFTVHNRDFTKSIAKAYTTLDMLIDGNDDTDYNEIDIIAKRQFTGLQDKNGVDIYEGDIVEQEKNCMYHAGRNTKEVRFADDQFLSGDCSLYGAVNSFDAIVIGNIHENPELLNN